MKKIEEIKKEMATISSVAETLYFIENQRYVHTPPRKPILAKEHTLKDVEEYSLKLSEYENLLAKHKAEKEISNEYNKQIETLIYEYIKVINC